MTFTIDPERDLVLERTADVPPEAVWAAWTEPERLKRWFTPDPWKTVDCTIDLRPGGQFRTVMRSPEGQEFTGDGCILEVVTDRKLVWTSALGPGYRPNTGGLASTVPFLFTAMIEIEPDGAGTRYRATVMHGDPSSREKHAAMGFADGWSAAFDQLVAMVEGKR